MNDVTLHTPATEEVSCFHTPLATLPAGLSQVLLMWCSCRIVGHWTGRFFLPARKKWERTPAIGLRPLNRNRHLHHLIRFLPPFHLNWFRPLGRRLPDLSRRHLCSRFHLDCLFLQWHPWRPCRCPDPFPLGFPSLVHRSFPSHCLGLFRLSALGRRRGIHPNQRPIPTPAPRCEWRQHHHSSNLDGNSMPVKTIPPHS